MQNDNLLLNLHQKRHRLPAIQQTVIVRQRQVHHRPDLDFAVDGHGLLFDGVQAQHGGLREVDDGRAHERAEDAAVADGVCAAGHVFDGEFVVAGLHNAENVVSNL